MEDSEKQQKSVNTRKNVENKKENLLSVARWPFVFLLSSVSRRGFHPLPYFQRIFCVFFC